MTTNVSKFIAVSGDVKTAGASVWWRLSGAFARGALAFHLEEAGLDSEEWLPPEPSPERNFGRAVRALYKDVTHNIETLKGGGYAIIKKTKSETDVTHETDFAVKLENKIVTAVEYAPVDALLAITEEMIHFSNVVIADDVSAWLIRSAERLGAVSLRDRGGIYFIPNHALETWTKLTSALVAASNGAHTVYSMTTLHEDNAVEAVLDALSIEATEFFSKCEEKLEKGTIGGKRAIKNRMVDSEKLLEKIRSYENLLGRKLETLTEHLADVELELSAALLAAEAGDGGEVKLAL